MIWTFTAVLKRRKLGTFETIRAAVQALRAARAAAGLPHEGHIDARPEVRA